MRMVERKDNEKDGTVKKIDVFTLNNVIFARVFFFFESMVFEEE